jgi:hypothetical protein
VTIAAASPDSSSARERFPLLPIATHKFTVLCVVTFGIYSLYWFYQNWKRIQDDTRIDVSPFWRTFFAPIFGFALFGQIRDLASSEGIVVRWNPTVLGSVYLLLSICWRIPDPWGLISLAFFVPIVPVQMTAQRLNAKAIASTEDPNRHYTGWNILGIVVGGLLWVLVIIGLTMAPAPD